MIFWLSEFLYSALVDSPLLQANICKHLIENYHNVQVSIPNLYALRYSAVNVAGKSTKKRDN